MGVVTYVADRILYWDRILSGRYALLMRTEYFTTYHRVPIELGTRDQGYGL